jgi:hypothetical protein
MARLPVPGSDDGSWGTILNDFLSQTHSTDGTLKPNIVTGTSIQNGAISEAKLDPSAQAKLNSGGTAGVTTVNTRSGAVTLTAADVGLANANNTSDANKPISSATQTALDGKAATAHTHVTTDITGLTEATQDTIASTLVAGTNVTLNYNDGAGTLTVSATPGAGVTDLSTTYAADSITVVSSTGNDALIDDATTSNAGVLSAADKTKLNGIQSGAEANAVDSVNGQTGAVLLDIDDVAPDQTDEGGKVLGTDGTNTTWTTLPVTPPAVATTVYDDANDARPANADIVFWIPDDPALADPTNAAVGDVVFRSNTIEAFTYALSDESTAITSGTAKVTVRAPYAFTVTGVRASLTTASSSGVVTIDINKTGSTILSTKLTIDQGERTSMSAAAPAVISDSIITDDAELTFDIDTAGTSAAGLKVTLLTRRG